MSLSHLGDVGAAAAAILGGLIAGSFLNVVIHRGPRLWGLVDGESRGGLAVPRSYCPACKATIPPWGLVPVVSFIVQKGRCAACRAPISPRYPIVEATGALVAVAAIAAFGLTATALAAAIFGWALVALAFVDLETGYLPDAINYPLLAAGLCANAAGLFAPIFDAVIGAVVGFASFSAIGAAFEKLRGKEGLGLGDAKLLAAIGAWGGWVILPAVVLIGALATLAAIFFERRRGKPASFDQPVPFGPGLCAAGFIALLAAPRFVSGL